MKWSKYNCLCCEKVGENIIYNSLMNSILCIDEIKIENQEVINKIKDKLDGFIVEKSLNEEKLFRDKIEKETHNTDVLGCWIFVTQRCNLNCSYCWEKNNNLMKCDMSQDVCDKMLLWLHKECKKKQVRSLNITLTGGEPFLNFEILEKIVKEVKLWQIESTFCVISNGVLISPDLIRRSSEIGIHVYQITLDGTRDVHDKRRCYYDGSGTFKSIISNILSICRYDTNSQIIIRINIDNGNVENVSSLLKYLHKLGLNNNVIITMADTIISCKPPSVNLLNRIIELLIIAKSLGFKVLLPEMNHCWLPYDCWLMFNVDGKIYKCPDFVGQTNFAVGDVWNGIYKNEYFRQTSIKPWKNCLNCEIVGLCRGGCIYRDRFQNHNRKMCRKAYIKKLLSLKIQWRLEHENSLDETYCNFFE